MCCYPLARFPQPFTFPDKTRDQQTSDLQVTCFPNLWLLHSLKNIQIEWFSIMFHLFTALKRGTRRPTGKRSSLTINPIDRSNGDRIKVRAIWAAAAAAAVESGRLWRRRKPRESPATYHFGPHQRALRRHCDGASASECGGLPAIKRWRC